MTTPTVIAIIVSVLLILAIFAIKILWKILVELLTSLPNDINLVEALSDGKYDKIEGHIFAASTPVEDDQSEQMMVDFSKYEETKNIYIISSTTKSDFQNIIGKQTGIEKLSDDALQEAIEWIAIPIYLGDGQVWFNEELQVWKYKLY